MQKIGINGQTCLRSWHYWYWWGIIFWRCKVNIEISKTFKIVEYVSKWADEGKRIYISALDGDFNRKGFGNFLQLIPKADKIEKLLAVCAFCGQDAPFSFKETLSE